MRPVLPKAQRDAARGDPGLKRQLNAVILVIIISA
jgi:hypothetical protein